MKRIIPILIFLPFFAGAQAPDVIAYGASASQVKALLEDGYTMQSGWTVKPGDTLRLGKGSMPNKSFAFIYESLVALTSSTDKVYLNSGQARVAIVKDIFPYGTKKGGFTIIAKVGIGSLSNYWIEIDNAVESKEIYSLP